MQICARRAVFKIERIDQGQRHQIDLRLIPKGQAGRKRKNKVIQEVFGKKKTKLGEKLDKIISLLDNEDLESGVYS